MKAVVARWMFINEITMKRCISGVVAFLVLLFFIVFQSCGETTTLKVIKKGDGKGKLHIIWANNVTVCTSDTTITFLKGSEITLRAIPEPASAFGGWDSPNSDWIFSSLATSTEGGTTIKVTMTEDKTIEAFFNEVGYKLTIQRQGGGSVRAGSMLDPEGNLRNPPIVCGPAGVSTLACEEISHYFPRGTRVVIQTFPTWVNGIVTWGGDCEGAVGITCFVTMNGPKTVVVRVP